MLVSDDHIYSKKGKVVLELNNKMIIDINLTHSVFS